MLETKVILWERDQPGLNEGGMMLPFEFTFPEDLDARRLQYSIKVLVDVGGKGKGKPVVGTVDLVFV